VSFQTPWASPIGSFRRSPFRLRKEEGRKEWIHFCVPGGPVPFVLNFSICDDLRPGARAGAEIGRVVFLARDGAWEGDVDTFAMSDVSVAFGRADARFGQSSIEGRAEALHVAVTMSDCPLRAELELVPESLPLARHGTPLSPGVLHWLAVPRLRVSGRIEIAGRVHELAGELGYHDQNWGNFRWGQDVSWDWGFGLPLARTSPWSIVFSRLTNRHHTRTFVQGLFLWENGAQRCLFRDQEVVVELAGRFRPERKTATFPRVTGLLLPAEPLDVPERITLHAARERDEVKVVFDARDVARIAVPSEVDAGIVVIHEVTGEIRLTGKVGGVAIGMEGTGVFEHLGA
jgi:hypothetical protein